MLDDHICLKQWTFLKIQKKVDQYFIGDDVDLVTACQQLTSYSLQTLSGISLVGKVLLEVQEVSISYNYEEIDIRKISQITKEWRQSTAYLSNAIIVSCLFWLGYAYILSLGAPAVPVSAVSNYVFHQLTFPARCVSLCVVRTDGRLLLKIMFFVTYLYFLVNILWQRIGISSDMHLYLSLQLGHSFCLCQVQQIDNTCIRVYNYVG